jgi:hypothetical protein
MPDTLYIPQYQLTINGFDVTAVTKPYIISITIDDTFDSEFTVSKLEIIFHANYLRNSSWKYKDQLKLEIWWLPFPTFKYISPIFYVDYVDDIKSSGGLQTYRISALEADPELGFKYSANEIVFNNKTVKTALSDFATLYGLTLIENAAPDVFLGVTSTTDIANSRITFSSYAAMLRYICQSYGYLGSLTGKKIEIEQINSTYNNSTRFFIWDMPEVYSLNFKATYTQLNKRYIADFVNRTDSNQIQQLFLQPAMQTQLNNKERIIDSGSYQYNYETAAEKLYGTMYRDFLTGFEIIINCSALPEFTAGYVFLLNATYGRHEGYYKCTKVAHRIDSGGWNSEVTGFPLRVLNSTEATFNIGYYGQTNSPNDPTKIFDLSENIGGRTFVLAANKLDEYAKYVNPNYTLNIGNLFLDEGNKSGNKVKPDLAFCYALHLTQNFTNLDLIAKRNPFNLGTFANPEINATFSTWLLGVRAGIQHLFAYRYPTSEMNAPQDPIVSPRYGFVTRGIAPTYSDLTGRWTEGGIDIGEIVRAKAIELYNRSYPDYTTTFID